MPALLYMADAVVLPSYNDACSRLILEGLAVGRAGVTTRFNGAADFLGEGKYGLVIDRCDDVEALAEALLNLCDPQHQRQMSDAIASDDVCEQVSVHRHARQLMDLYGRLGDFFSVPAKS